ncbi:MAG: hypothetical protein ACOC6S_03730 [Chloroflexota bacterium]
MATREETTVVSFRIGKTDCQKLKRVKHDTGLSFADLVLMGAGIADQERRSKIAEHDGLEQRLSKAKIAAERAEREAEQAGAAERERRLATVDTELRAFELFSVGWSADQVAFELGLDPGDVYEFLKRWGEKRGQQEKVDVAMIRACARQMYREWEQSELYCGTSSFATADDMRKCHDNKEIALHFMTYPDEVPADWREFLITDYLGKCLKRHDTFGRP